MSGGHIYDAFDGLDVGVRARELAEWFRGHSEAQFGALTGRAFGAALSIAIVAVEAERRTRGSRAEPAAEGEWHRDADWQLEVHRAYELAGGEAEFEPVAWRKTPLQALMAREPCPGDRELRWHLSVAHMDRVPCWEELVDAAHNLRPGVVFVLGLPPRSWWLNFDERVLHLWEVRDGPLVESWRANPSAGQKPT